MAKDRRGRVVAVVAVLVLCGGVAKWLAHLGGEPRSLAPVAGGGGPRRGLPGRFAEGLPEDDTPRVRGRIEGVVVDAAGRPVAGAQVALTRALARNEPLPLRPTSPVRAATVSSDGGRFRFVDLSPADYGVGALAAGAPPGHVAVIGLRPDEVRQIEVRLGQGGVVLTGRVLDAGDGTIPGARLTLTAWDGARPGEPPRTARGVADERGAFEVTLARGSYSVHVEASGYIGAFDNVLLTRSLTRDFRLAPGARILGRVVERTSRQPVPDAEVSLGPADRTAGGPPFEGATRTDAGGAFSLADLEAGNFQLTARKGPLSGRASRVITLGLAQVVSDVEIEVSPAPTVSGRVRVAGGGGLVGARVSLLPAEGPARRPVHDTTAADGAYAILGVLPGRYRLETDPPGHGRASRSVQVGSADVADADLEVSAGAVVSGRVVDGEDRPVAGVRVTASVESPGAGAIGGLTAKVDQAISKADGSFELGSLGSGRLRLVAQEPEGRLASVGPETVAPGEHKRVTLKLQKGGFVSGTVRTRDRAPAPDVRVAALIREMRGGAPSHASTDGDGRYRLGPLPRGTVTVAADRRGQMSFKSGGQEPPNQKTVALGEGEDRGGVDLIVDGGGQSLSGVVVGPDGKPVGLATVIAVPETGGRAARDNRADRTFTSHDGQWSVDNLSTGPHTVWAVHPDYPDAEQKGVAAGTRAVRLQFSRGVVVTGVVTDKAGQPVADYTVTAAPGPPAGESPGQRSRRQMVVFDRPAVAVHDAAGAFTLHRLGPGSYELMVAAVDGRTGAQVVELQAGEKRAVRIVVDGGVRITGRAVEHGSGAPLAGAEVRALGPGNAQVETTAGADGTFTLENVPVDNRTARISIAADTRTHVPETRIVELPPGATTHDLGAVALMRGNYREQMESPDRGTIGAYIDADKDVPSIRGVQASSAAAKAGLKRGDRIIAVEGKAVAGLGGGAVNFLVTGRAGTTVTITVQTPGSAPRPVPVVREPSLRTPS